jgi:wyosine [tRNA(Phe)-imidazoG37] synthetase (radical SAM superfamily)
MPRRLSVTDHDRDAQGLEYVYAVVSRRAGGVSVGINLNPNNACNWRCVYCQVPDLQRGVGPEIDMAKLESELGGMLDDIVEGDFLERSAPPEARELKDVAFSGNGEPTTSPQFAEAIALAARLLAERALDVPVTLITNGSMLNKARNLDALEVLRGHHGRVWFKLDVGTSEGARRVNGQPLDLETHLKRLRQSAERCPTWVQTCVFAMDGEPPPEPELDAYVEHLRRLTDEGVPLEGVLLYTLARPSMQPEAPRLAALDRAWLDQLAERIVVAGLKVDVA